MEDHFGNTIHEGDYIIHARYYCGIIFNAGKVLKVDTENHTLICKMCNRERLSYISNMYNTFITDISLLYNSYPKITSL